MKRGKQAQRIREMAFSFYIFFILHFSIFVRLLFLLLLLIIVSVSAFMFQFLYQIWSIFDFQFYQNSSAFSILFSTHSNLVGFFSSIFPISVYNNPFNVIVLRANHQHYLVFFTVWFSDSEIFQSNTVLPLLALRIRLFFHSSLSHTVPKSNM